MGFQDTQADKDEFERYSGNEPTLIHDPKAFNPITWWYNQKEAFPSLHLYAFDTLAIPAMSAECERVFSSTKKLLTPERSRLAPDIIEASECLKNWWDRGLIQQLEDE
jgi:hypothetical protein